MNTTDPIADMLTRIRNANQAKFKTHPGNGLCCRWCIKM